MIDQFHGRGVWRGGVIDFYDTPMLNSQVPIFVE